MEPSVDVGQLKKCSNYQHLSVSQSSSLLPFYTKILIKVGATFAAAIFLALVQPIFMKHKNRFLNEKRRNLFKET